MQKYKADGFEVYLDSYYRFTHAEIQDKQLAVWLILNAYVKQYSILEKYHFIEYIKYIILKAVFLHLI